MVFINNVNVYHVSNNILNVNCVIKRYVINVHNKK